MKFLDLTTGLPHLWNHIITKIGEHNSSSTSHSDIRTALDGKLSTGGGTVSGKLTASDYCYFTGPIVAQNGTTFPSYHFAKKNGSNQLIASMVYDISSGRFIFQAKSQPREGRMTV